MHYQYIVYKWDIAQSHINTLRKVPSIYYKLVCKIVCNFQHYFGGRSKRESSCLEIRSSARFLREIWISYFARRILEGVFVGGIVNIRNECLFFSVHGNESQCGTNKSRELRSFFLGSWEMNRSAEQTNRTRTASRFTRFVCSALRFISHEPRKKDTLSFKKLLFQYIHVFALVLHAAG